MANYAIVIYTTYHHIATMAESVKAGVLAAGHQATIYQVPETLSEEVLGMLHAPAKPDYPEATPEVLAAADGIIFGAPTRFGKLPAQLMAFIDATGSLWASGGLYGKPTTMFVSTGTGGGRETTVLSIMSTFAHHGMIYIPLGYANAFGELTNLDEVHGASAWGAGCIAGGDGSRQPSELELKIAKIQGENFATSAARFVAKGSESSSAVPSDEKKAAQETTKTAAAAAAKKESKPAAPKPEESSKCCVIV